MPTILLVKTSSMGDVIHNLPILADISAHVPEAVYHWVVEEAFAEIPAMHPRVEKVIPVATRRWRRRLFRPHTWREIGECRRLLRQYTYDYIIDTQGLIKSALLASWAQGPIYGMNRQSAREGLAAVFYRYRFDIPRDLHAVDRNRMLAAQTFAYQQPESPPDYGINTQGQPIDEPGLPERYLVCLHGSSRASKLWPELNWLQLAGQLHAKGIRVVFPWGNQAEHERACRG